MQKRILISPRSCGSIRRETESFHKQNKGAPSEFRRGSLLDDYLFSVVIRRHLGFSPFSRASSMMMSMGFVGLRGMTRKM